MSLLCRLSSRIIARGCVFLAVLAARDKLTPVSSSPCQQTMHPPPSGSIVGTRLIEAKNENDIQDVRVVMKVINIQ